MARHASEEASGHGETPFLGAIGWSHFEAAAHMMLKKGSDYEHFGLLARNGARFDLPNKESLGHVEGALR